MTGVQAQAAKLLEQIKSMSFSAAKKKGMYLDIGKMEVLQMALEKQVPEKPTEISDGVCPEGYPVWEYFCPRCGCEFDEYEYQYCCHCGQAIDWRKIHGTA